MGGAEGVCVVVAVPVAVADLVAVCDAVGEVEGVDAAVPEPVGVDAADPLAVAVLAAVVDGEAEAVADGDAAAVVDADADEDADDVAVCATARPRSAAVSRRSVARGAIPVGVSGRAHGAWIRAVLAVRGAVR